MPFSAEDILGAVETAKEIMINPCFRKTEEGCGGLRGENPAAFLKTGPIFQQPFALPENAQTLTGIAFRAAGKSVKNVAAASKFAGKLFQQGISDSHSLLEFSDCCPDDVVDDDDEWPRIARYCETMSRGYPHVLRYGVLGVST